jgi:hypothetical protein
MYDMEKRFWVRRNDDIPSMKTTNHFPIALWHLWRMSRGLGYVDILNGHLDEVVLAYHREGLNVGIQHVVGWAHDTLGSTALQPKGATDD